MRKKFKKLSVERLSSPEQLASVLDITRAPEWIALSVLFLLTLFILLWSIFGRIAITEDGNGIFFDPYSVIVIQNSFEGKVESIFVREGDNVKKGELLFSLSNPLKLLEYQQLSKHAQQLDADSEGFAQIKLKEDILEANLQHLSVRAPADGTILSVDVPLGKFSARGSTLAWMQVDDDQKGELIYAFFPLSLTEQIKPGMAALIAFDSVSQEIYGKMRGTVKDVLLPATAEGYALQSIPSEQLRDFLTRHQANMQVRIQPVKEDSGYKWTKGNGPPFPIPKGSVAQVSIFLEQKRPISYLIR